MAATETKKPSPRKNYQIEMRHIVGNTNSRNPLRKPLTKKGWTAFGEKSLWAIAMSSDAEQRAEYVKLLDEHEPDLVSMAATMLTQGQQQPIKVRENGGGSYTVADGCRRCLAILYNWCSLGRPKEPVVDATLMKGNDGKLLMAGIVANIRKQPTLFEEATTIRSLVNNGESEESVAESLGMSKATIKNRLALLDLPPKQRKAVADGEQTATSAIKESKESNGHEPKTKMRTRKEIEEALECYSAGTKSHDVLSWVLGLRDTHPDG